MGDKTHGFDPGLRDQEPVKRVVMMGRQAAHFGGVLGANGQQAITGAMEPTQRFLPGKPSACLIAISQILAALTQSCACSASSTSRACWVRRGLSVIAHSAIWVSSSRFTLLVRP